MASIGWKIVEANLETALRYVGCCRVVLRGDVHHLYAETFISWLSADGTYELPEKGVGNRKTCAKWIDDLLLRVFHLSNFSGENGGSKQTSLDVTYRDWL